MERYSPVPGWGGVRLRHDIIAGVRLLQHDHRLVFLLLVHVFPRSTALFRVPYGRK